MKNAIRTLLGSETVKEETSELTENAISAFMMDPIAVKDLIKKIWTMPSRIRDGIYWENFAAYLLHVYEFDETTGVFF